MEDISRELEKEIAQSRPKPYKKSVARRIIIVDDFGRMKSGEYLKTMVLVLCGISVVCFSLTLLFYFLFSGVSGRAEKMESELSIARQKVQDLIDEKEILMAKVVMLGQDPSHPVGEPTDSEMLAPAPSEELSGGGDNKEGIPVKETSKVDIQKNPAARPQKQSEPKVTAPDDKKTPFQGTKTIRAENRIVSIEKFTVTKDGNNGDLLVRFDIRNISEGPGDVSGRIFTVLKPETGSHDQWLVVPSSGLNDGIPGEYRKGQYFSIAHFKPVKFRIKNTSGPDFFKTASIYIFNNQGELIFEKLIQITEGEITQ
jgi:hypothetical protein